MTRYFRFISLSFCLCLSNACEREAEGDRVSGAESSTVDTLPAAPFSGEPRGPECEPTASLRLELAQVVPSSFTTPPIALSSLNGSSFVAVTHSGQLVSFGAAPESETRSAPLVFAGLGSAKGSALAFTDRTIFRVRSGEHLRKLSTDHRFHDLRVVEGDAVTDRVWVVDGGETARKVIRLHPAEDTYQVSESWDVPGNWRLTAVEGEEALLISTRPPFKMVRLLSRGQTRGLGSLKPFSQAYEASEEARVFLSAVTSIDCGAVLLTLADIRSTDRWLFVVDADTGKVLKQGHLGGTIGFFGSDIDARKVYAFRGTDGFGEVLIYQWSWSSPPALQGANPKEKK